MSWFRLCRAAQESYPTDERRTTEEGGAVFPFSTLLSNPDGRTQAAIFLLLLPPKVAPGRLWRRLDTDTLLFDGGGGGDGDDGGANARAHGPGLPPVAAGGAVGVHRLSLSFRDGGGRRFWRRREIISGVRDIFVPHHLSPLCKKASVAHFGL